jgi:hypothetical protein
MCYSFANCEHEEPGVGVGGGGCGQTPAKQNCANEDAIANATACEEAAKSMGREYAGVSFSPYANEFEGKSADSCPAWISVMVHTMPRKLPTRNERRKGFVDISVPIMRCSCCAKSLEVAGRLRFLFRMC